MSLMQVLVYARVVQTTVNPVNEKVGEEEEERELKPIVPHSGTVGCDVVHLAVAAYLGQKEGNSVNGHDGYRF